jgi:hypothetical protein
MGQVDFCMKTLTLNLSDKEQEELNKRAAELGLSLEELAKKSLQRFLSVKPVSFEAALKHTIEKNGDLYKRLA